MRNLKNKIAILLITLLFISFMMPICLAYETEEYSIDIPEGFSLSKSAFSDAEGNSINVNILDYNQSENVSQFYTNSTLDYVTNEVKSGTEEYRNSVRNSLKEEYGDSYTDEQIESYVSTINYNDMVKKEVTTFTKNNYKCLHFISDLSLNDSHFYTDQYETVSNGKIIVLTVSSFDRDFFEKDEIKAAIDSFTIKNFVDDAEVDASNTIFGMQKDRAIKAGIALLVIIVVSIIIKVIKPKK